MHVDVMFMFMFILCSFVWSYDRKADDSLVFVSIAFSFLSILRKGALFLV